ncbi:MAG TPA: UbiA family prenyltransferase [Gemmatimonadales bacterium]|nr:UbiA family prenyltransferase [Gemmatimonadales bacterium]
MSDAAAIPPARKAGYRLFGRSFDFLLHMRPAEWPIMAAHTALGYLLAVGLAGARAGAHLGPALGGLALWVICLNGGTLAINSAFDRDEGDVAYLRKPPPPPRGLFAFGLAVMGAGQAGALLLGVPFALAYAFCFLLSVLYSVPPARLKAVAGADWLINVIGFGAMTPLAGWLATGLPLRIPETIGMLGFAPLFGALYPLTQLYQLEEDRRRGDRTFAVVLGPRSSLVVAITCMGVAFVMFGIAGFAAGWVEEPGAWRWGLLGLAFAAWVLLLVPWLRRAARLPASAHQRGMYLALGAWALTDAVVLAAWWG